MASKILESFFGKLSLIHLTAICALTALGVLFVYQRTYTVSLSKKVSSLEQEITKISSINTEKKLVIANLCSNSVLEQKATQICNMHSPSSHSVEVIVIRKNNKTVSNNDHSGFNIVKKLFKNKIKNLSDGELESIGEI